MAIVMANLVFAHLLFYSQTFRKMYLNFDKQGRRSIRLKGWDYRSPGWYFVTVCTQNRECLFGDIKNGAMQINPAGKIIEKEWQDLASRFDFMELDEYIIMPNHIHAILEIIGRGESCIRPASGNHHSESCIRPEHRLRFIGFGRSQGSPLQSKFPDPSEDHGRPNGTETKSLGRIIQTFKSKTTHHYIQALNDFNLKPFNIRLWQRNYYEHIIRNETELNQIRQYIYNNPAAWSQDEENPER